MRLFMGDRASLVLEGQKVIPTRLLQEGFSFKYSSVKEALKDLVG
jgi:NAD dependent epimerase/dehydratase family enzyme